METILRNEIHAFGKENGRKPKEIYTKPKETIGNRGRGRPYPWGAYHGGGGQSTLDPGTYIHIHVTHLPPN